MTLTYEHLLAAMRLLERPDPRPYGNDTVYIVNAHTWSVIMHEDSITRNDFYIRGRIKIDGEWANVPTGQVLLAHRDAMYSLTEEPQWEYYLAGKYFGQQLTDGEIDIDQYLVAIEHIRKRLGVDKL